MTVAPYEHPLASLEIPHKLLDWATEHAHAIDSGDIEAREILPQVAAAGLIDLGAPFNKAGGLLQQAATLETLAQRSLSSAFALWGHRMSIEFLELAGGAFAESVLSELRSGTTPGASAMAPGYKALTGAGDLDLRVTRNELGTLRLSGHIAWASNLYSDALAVAPAYGPAAGTNPTGARGGVIVAFPLGAPGVEIGPALNILAMRGTASTYVTLNDVPLSEDQILTDDFDDLLNRSRPTLSILQASFCLGLAAASYDHAVENATGFNVVFLEEIQQLGEQLTSTKHHLVTLATRVGTAQPPNPRDVLAMRLQAGQLAVQLATLETKTSGGKAYVTTSDTNRRYREATFVPLQSPSEAQLLWELAKAE